MKIFLIGFGAVTLAVIIIVSVVSAVSPESFDVPEQELAEQEASTEEAEAEEAVPDYKILKKETEGVGINAALLYEGGDPEQAKRIALDYKKTCASDCNVEIWDNREAFNVNSAYDQKYADYSFEESQAWEQENLILVAEHFIGWIIFSESGVWQEYPLKDWRYQEIKENQPV